ncbi:hypothetical protein SKAU_G00245540 [Synaphobranchus kaupii]|uniref:Uncharacterized protein n=1 Tax=Synaphobranchus kaupii TaxID=118154 RepID=A0A9Q1F1T5_SYNKA|nr:hypothetical protein SKAU_G00245540 [Synaphobranchus kaupii]
MFKDTGEELCKAYRGKEGKAKPQAKPPLEDPNDKNKPPPYAGADNQQKEEKGGRPQYIPWGSQDLQNLITTLPEIQDGAAIWIRTLEEEMMGKTMALGDVKALLGKVVGKEKMLDIIEQAGYKGAEKSAVNGRKFDQYRQRIWDSLRKAYPTRSSTAMLKGGRGPSGSQPTVVYNFSGVPPPAFPMPVYIQGAVQGAHHKIGDKGTKGGLGTNQGIKGKGIRTGDKDREVICSRGPFRVCRNAGDVGKQGI